MKAITLMIVPLILSLTTDLSLAQAITTVGRKFAVALGKEVELPCVIPNRNADNVVIWKRNPDRMLFMDSDPMEDDFEGRMEVKQEGDNSMLIIRNVEQYDDANYTCIYGDDSQITHKVDVLVPPKVTLSLNTITTRQGENVTVRCYGTGHPTPKVTWRRIGKAIPVTAKVLEDGILRLDDIDIGASGTYECEASNSHESKATGQVEISVTAREDTDNNAKGQAAPTVETNRTYMSVNEGETVELTCRYDGSPAPTADWLFNSFNLNKEKHQATESARFANGFSYTTLTINNITSESFGDYSCRVANKIGTEQRVIYVSNLPGPPALSLPENDEIQLIVESKQPIIEYKIKYRLANEDTFNKEQIVKANKDDLRGDFWHRSIPLDFLKSNTDYELQGLARNKQNAQSGAKKAYDDAKDTFDEKSKEFRERFNDARERASHEWDKAKDKASNEWKNAKDEFSDDADELKKKSESFRDRASHEWDKAKDKASHEWKNAKNEFSDDADELKKESENFRDRVSHGWDKAKDKLSSEWKHIKSEFSDDADKLKKESENFRDRASNEWENAKDKASHEWKNAKNELSDDADELKKKSENFRDRASDILNEAKEEFPDSLDRDRIRNEGDHVADTLKLRKEQLKEGFHDGKERVQAEYHKIEDSLRDMIDEGHERAKATADKLRNKVNSGIDETSNPFSVNDREVRDKDL